MHGGGNRQPHLPSAAEVPTNRATSTTLSDPQLTKPLFGLLHPLQVSRATDKQQPREDFLYEGACLRKGEARPLARPHPLGLHKRIGDSADRHVVLPARIAPAFEVVESEFGLEVLVVRFDRPAVMSSIPITREFLRESDEVPKSY